MYKTTPMAGAQQEQDKNGQKPADNGRHEALSFTPFANPAEVILLATAILVLNSTPLTKEEKDAGATRKVELLGLSLDPIEKRELIWSGQKYREEYSVQATELGSPRTRADLLKSIRHLQGNLDERRQMAGIAIPQDPAKSFRERVVKRVCSLNVAQLEGLYDYVQNAPLPVTAPPTANPKKVSAVNIGRPSGR